MSIEKKHSGTYTAVDINYKRPDCVPPNGHVRNHLDHLKIMVIYKSIVPYPGSDLSRILVGPLCDDDMSDFLSVTPRNKFEIEYTMYLRKTDTTDLEHSIELTKMYCIGTYQGTDNMKNYLVFSDKWPKDEAERIELLKFKLPAGM